MALPRNTATEPPTHAKRNMPASGVRRQRSQSRLHPHLEQDPALRRVRSLLTQVDSAVAFWPSTASRLIHTDVTAASVCPTSLFIGLCRLRLKSLWIGKTGIAHLVNFGRALWGLVAVFALWVGVDRRLSRLYSLLHGLPTFAGLLKFRQQAMSTARAMHVKIDLGEHTLRPTLYLSVLHQ